VSLPDPLQPAKRLRQATMPTRPECHATSRLAMHGGLPHRPGYAVVPQFKPGVVRRAIALRGNQRPDHGDSALPWDDRFHDSGVVVPAMP
jgi:hypothetical protein